jgi:hypothetical protein
LNYLDRLLIVLNMGKEDTRFQTVEQLHERRRKQVVRLHKKGTQVMSLVAVTGVELPDCAGRD